MDQRAYKVPEPQGSSSPEKLLEDRHEQLSTWAMTLTRGDAGKAQDIVQDLCLYFMLSKPDLSSITNLDGYLYTCLRNLYVSNMARSTREAQHVVSLAQFDSVESTLKANPAGDLVQTQNDLRRICSYAAWRKESAKSASCFILHFFLGYYRREVAAISGLPISAIYNNLKTARTEIKTHLESQQKIQLVAVDGPVDPPLSWTPVPSNVLFRELLNTIRSSCTTPCLPEGDLLAHYKSDAQVRISAALLAHIASCERCLSLIDSHFQWPKHTDRESLEGLEGSPGGHLDNKSESKRSTVPPETRILLRRREQTYEHRPEVLSIAVNGKIIALHNIEGPQSILTARIEQQETAKFVEVFSEQNVRLAFVPILELPPDGPAKHAQRVELSDSRWLELHLTFDGLGLNSQATYFDPALERLPAIEEAAVASVPATQSAEESYPVTLRPEISTARKPWLSLGSLFPSSTWAWALALSTLLVIALVSYRFHSHQEQPLSADTVIQQAIGVETAALKGNAVHSVFRVELPGTNGNIEQVGSIEVWKDSGQQRYSHRVFDSRNQLFAEEWNTQKSHGSYRSSTATQAPALNRVPVELLLNQELSPQAFESIADGHMEIRETTDGYELTAQHPGSSTSQLVSATLTLTRNLQPIRETLLLRRGDTTTEVHLIQTSYDVRPSRAVPDEVFHPRDTRQPNWHSESEPAPSLFDSALRTRLTELQIAVLYELHHLNADTGEPIEVARSAGGHIRVSGTVANRVRRQQIIDALSSLANRTLLDIQIGSQDSLRSAHAARGAPAAALHVYNVGDARPPGEALLRKYYENRGLSGDALDAAIAHFCQTALEHADSTLQRAYALNRLGSVFEGNDVADLNLSSRQHWADLVNANASILAAQIEALEQQLNDLPLSRTTSDESIKQLAAIENPTEFAGETRNLLRKAQRIDELISKLFASGNSSMSAEDIASMIRETHRSLPLNEAANLRTFASDLRQSASASLKK